MAKRLLKFNSFVVALEPTHCILLFPFLLYSRNLGSCSFNKLLLQKEELEQKHVHLLQVVESEKTAKWQYTQQCEELASEIRKLRAEVNFITQTLKWLEW